MIRLLQLKTISGFFWGNKVWIQGKSTLAYGQIESSCDPLSILFDFLTDVSE